MISFVNNKTKLITFLFNLKVFQECNSHAISVWKRVSQKLDGKDPDPYKALNVQEQVQDYFLFEFLFSIFN